MGEQANSITPQQIVNIFFLADTNFPYKTYTGYTVTSRILFYLIAGAKNMEPIKEMVSRTGMKAGTLKIYVTKLIKADIFSSTVVKGKLIVHLTPAGKQVRADIRRLINEAIQEASK